MIPITPQIVGLGIDEEYADALERIEKLEAALKGVAPSNDTREGRVLYQLRWLRQEITPRTRCPSGAMTAPPHGVQSVCTL